MQHDFGEQARLPRRSAKWLDKVYGPGAGSVREPAPTSIAARHYTYASFDPEADARDLFEELVDVIGEERPDRDQLRLMRRAGGACAAVGFAQGVAEIRFERISVPGSPRLGAYSAGQFLEYKRLLTNHLLKLGEYGKFIALHS